MTWLPLPLPAVSAAISRLRSGMATPVLALIARAKPAAGIARTASRSQSNDALRLSALLSKRAELREAVRLHRPTKALRKGLYCDLHDILREGRK